MCTNFKSPIKRRLHEKFEANWPGGSEDKLFKSVDGQRTMERLRRRVITIAHPEPLAQVS